MVIMKKILYIIMALTVLIGCQKPAPTPEPEPEPEEKKIAEQAVGEWHCVNEEEQADIYLSLAEDLKFELYQKITQGSYRLYRGTWSVDEEEDIISGQYNDGEPWAKDYLIVISEDGKTMNLIAKETIGTRNYKYTRTEIPGDIKENCIVVVKSYPF